MTTALAPWLRACDQDFLVLRKLFRMRLRKTNSLESAQDFTRLLCQIY